MSPHSEVMDDESNGVRSASTTNGTTTTTTNGLNGVNGYSHSSTSSSSPSPSIAALGNGLHSTLHSRRQPQQKIHSERSAYLTSPPVDADAEYDLICVGYGPASLGVAVAMHDALASGKKLRPDGSVPRVLFLEQQARFAWHAGMLLQGARMQISFVKDLASLRDPRSEFTFLNYLHRQNRLVEFTNLGTFLPARNEYEDYLRWCASFFDHLVRYNSRVVSVAPNDVSGNSVRSFTVQAQNIKTGQLDTYRGRNILLATGGQPALPKSFPVKHPRVIHSSQYAHLLPQMLPKSTAPYRVVVVGAGQSAAEIFRNVQHLYPNSQTWLVMRQEFLKPSDDSPFVNTVFNPDFVDNLYPRSPRSRQGFLTEVRATNYGVVRLELIEELYEAMYEQMRHIGRDETQWPHRIMASRHISHIEPTGDDKVEVKVQRISPDNGSAGGIDDYVDLGSEETIDADLVIAATGYNRSAHVDMLKDTWSMLPKAAPTTAEYKRGIAGWNVATPEGERKMAVGRDYKVKYAPGAVADEAGIWLQGLCEGTHGVSDSLLSVIATRSGEIVDTIFGRDSKN